MKRTLAIMAAALLLALPLTGCGASDGSDGTMGTGTTATGTMHNDGGGYGTGTNTGATANTGTANGYLGGVADSVNRSGRYQYGYSATDSALYRPAVDYSDTAAVHRAAKAGDNYARMLENGRVHDTDGFILDGENAHWNTL